MKVFTYIIITIAVSIAVPYFSAKNNRSYFLGIVIMIAGLCGFAYLHFSEPFKVEDYDQVELLFESGTLDKSEEKFIFIAEGKEYGLYLRILDYQDKLKVGDFHKNLKKSPQAKVWLDSKKCQKTFYQRDENKVFIFTPRSRSCL